MKVINLWAGPGAGKSTMAAGVFSDLKRAGIPAELVTEYAKDLVWDDTTKLLEDPILTFAQQRHRIIRLDTKVDFVVTDSPFPLVLIYEGDRVSPEFRSLVMQEFNNLTNLNYFVRRNKKYSEAGRLQTEEQAKVLDNDVAIFLCDMRIPYRAVTGDDAGRQWVVSDIMAGIRGGDITNSGHPKPGTAPSRRKGGETPSSNSSSLLDVSRVTFY